MGFERDDDPVGYSRPPGWAKFQPGRSGNPHGRPRKVQASKPATPLPTKQDQALRDELDRKIMVTDGRGSRKVPLYQIIYKRLAKEAAQGNVPATRELLREVRELERREAEASRIREEIEKNRTELKEREIKQMVAFRVERERVWRLAETEGKNEPDQPWPHPDDILIDLESQTWRPRGPFHIDDLLLYRYLRAQRDVLFVRAVVAMRSRSPFGPAMARFCTGTWLSYDVSLPKRWQLDGEPGVMTQILLLMPLRDLKDWARQCERTAEMLGAAVLPKPRHRKAAYAFANKVMAPILRRYGYQSLAQFERVYEETGGNPPWPHVGN